MNREHEGIKVSVRDTGADDYGAILSMNLNAMPAVSAANEDHLIWLVSAACFPKVAVVDGKVVGFMLGLPPGLEYQSENYRWFSDRYEYFVYVDRVVVKELYRGNGVGATLYDAVFQFAALRDVPVVLCEVNLAPRNEGSLRFHERLGFREVGQQTTDGGAKLVSLLEKRLVP